MIENLVFNGGGIKGTAYAGAIDELDRLGLLDGVVRVAGSSAGATTALCLACGHTPGEIMGLATLPNFSDFTDDSAGFLRDGWRLLRRYGVYKGLELDDYIRHIITSVGLPPGTTFSDLSELAADEEAARQHRLLTVPVCNITRQRLEYCSAEHTPYMPVFDAVRASCNIPLFWPAREIRGMLYGDAGLMDNYPIHIFDTKDPGGRRVPNPATVGFFLGAGPVEPAGTARIDSLSDYITTLVEIVMEQSNRTHVRDMDWERTVFIDPGGTRATDFALDGRRLDELVRSGRTAVAGSPVVARHIAESIT